MRVGFHRAPGPREIGGPSGLEPTMGNNTTFKYTATATTLTLFLYADHGTSWNVFTKK